eukprot:2110346-Rhodomonas_salina.1
MWSRLVAGYRMRSGASYGSGSALLYRPMPRLREVRRLTPDHVRCQAAWRAWDVLRAVSDRDARVADGIYAGRPAQAEPQVGVLGAQIRREPRESAVARHDPGQSTPLRERSTAQRICLHTPAQHCPSCSRIAAVVRVSSSANA